MGKGSSSRAPSQNTTHQHDGGWQILLFIFYSSKKQQEMKLLEKTTSLVLLFLTSTPTRNECCGFGRSGIIVAKTFCFSQLRRRRIEPGFSPTPKELLVGARKREKLPRVGFVSMIHLKKTFATAPLKEKKEDKAKLGSISQQQQQQDQDCSALNGHGIPRDGKSKADESSPGHVPASYKKCCAFISLPQRLLFHWRTPKLLIETKKPQPASEGKSLGPPRFCLSCDILTQIIPSLRSSPGFHFILGRGAGVRLGESQKCPALGWC